MSGDRNMSYPRKFTIETPDGAGEATQASPDDVWHIDVPTTAFRWYGSVGEVKAEIRCVLGACGHDRPVSYRAKAMWKTVEWPPPGFIEWTEEGGAYAGTIVCIDLHGRPRPRPGTYRRGEVTFTRVGAARRKHAGF